jgi:8-oxo-dGTP pyrophosphatase MutT (NUDIX family)
VIDGLYRIGYRGAYLLMKAYWALRRPETHGALVAIWHEGRVLLVRNSYHEHYGFPGGYVRNGESAVQAALRELREEVGVSATEQSLTLGLDITHEWLRHPDHVEIFRLDVVSSPRIEVDNREVISAGFFDVDAALRLNLFPPIRRYLESLRTESKDSRYSAK